MGQLPGLLAVDPFAGGQLSAQLQVQVVREPRPHEKEDSGREGTDDECQHARIPEGQARAHATRGEPHPCLPPSMNPTPRRVWSSFFSNGSSIFRRSRAIETSITLSSGVARAATCHTSRASISLDAIAPREHEIEQYEVEDLVVHEEESFLTGGRDPDVIVLGLEPFAEGPGDLLVILDD